MKNKATLEFESNKLTDFDSWYTPDVVTYLTHLNKQAELLRYTFFDGDFKEQFQSINMLQNGLKQGFSFICKEPGVGQNHFIFGILIQNKLIFINPVGETAHKDFYEIAALIKKDYNLDIYLSNTIIQRDTNLGNKGIVSCGPICVELIRYISSLSEKEILSFLESSTNVTIQTKYELEYKEVNIKALLPESLNSLETTDLINYQHVLEEIRKQQLKVLAEDLSIVNLSLEKQNEFLEKNCINHPIQVEIRKSTQEGKLLEAVDRIKEYLLQQKLIMSKTVLKQEKIEETTSNSKPNTDYSDKEKTPINTRSEYDENMILMVWDSYLKQLAGIQYFVDSHQILNSLFNNDSMALQKSAGLLIKPESNKLYINSFNKSISICGSVNHKENTVEDAVTINLTIAIEQIKLWNVQQLELGTKIKDHTIIFPYHITDGHWALGILELNLNEESNLTHAEVKVFNPLPSCGGQKISSTAHTNIQNLLRASFDNAEINLITENSGHNKQQNDGVSCGVISAENGKDFLSSQLTENRLDQIYQRGAKDLRYTHIQEVSRDDFYQAQFNKPPQDPESYKPRNYEELKSDFAKSIESLEQNDKERILSIIKETNKNEEINVAIKIKDFIKDHQGSFQSILSLFKIDSEDWKFEGDHINTLVNIINESKVKSTDPEIDQITQGIKNLGVDYAQLNPITKDIEGYNKKAPINYVQIGKDITTKSYTADKTAEVGHPDANRKLSKAVDKVLVDKDISTLEGFHTKVYELLWQEPEFQKSKFKYSFKYKVSYNSRSVEIGESDNLLFWLLANGDSGKILTILGQYKFDIETVKDKNDNNILHIAALHGNHSVISKIVDLYFDGLITPNQFGHLINHRNNDGTNPLGMAFLSNLPYEKLIKVTELFVLRSFFEVNSYLNNKKGMDVFANDFLKQIGGFNTLHMALTEKYPKILEILYTRHKKGNESDTDPYYVNFKYPSLNPAHHMNSPEKVLKSKIIFSKQNEKIRCETLLKKYQLEQLRKEDEDDSGDSEDENSSAYIWKHVLTDMMESTEITKSEGTYVVPLFHGVPLMSGLYTHSDRKYVGKKLMLLNPGLTEKTKSIIKKQLGGDESPSDELKAVHSRTSTASAGMENLAKIVKADDGTLNRLGVIDDTLKSGLQKAFQQNNGIFKAQVVSFVNKFSSDVAHTEVWQNLTKINEELNNDLIVKYRFPLISTSKTADHGTKYGFGTNLELPRGEGKLEPYYKHGKPQHRLAGFLYVIKENVDEITEKLKSGKIFDICSLGGINALFQKQIEIAYLGGISKENILAIIPLIYPNFSKGFDPDYHGNVLSFSDKSAYTRAKTGFGKPELTEDGGLILTQQTENHKGQPNTLGACLTNIFVHFAEKITLKFSGGILVSKLPNQQDFIEYTTSQNYRLASTDFTSPNHKMLSQSKSKNSPSPKSIKVAKKLFQDTEIDSLTGQVDTLSLRNKLIVDDSPIKLCKAAHNGDDKVVTTLLTTITQEVIMEPDKNGHTALHHASYKGHKAIVKLLLDKAPQLINATDNNGYTALHFAEQQEFKEIVMLIKMKTLEKQMQLMVLTQEILLQQPALETEILVATVETNNTNTHQLEHLGNILEHQHNDFL